MEVAALGGLIGLGYIVSRLAGNGTKTGQQQQQKSRGVTESFQTQQRQVDPNPMYFKPGSQTVALKSPPTSALALTPQGASAVAPSPELDMMYQTPNGQTYPSEPSPGPAGSWNIIPPRKKIRFI